MQWPIPQFPRQAVSGAYVNTTSGGSANTKGSWYTLVSGLTAAGAWVNLKTSGTVFAGQDTSTIVDLAIGGSGSETVVAENLLIGNRGNRGTLFPLHLPAGATLRVRTASISASRSWVIGADIYAGEPDSGLSVPGRIVTYGASAGSSSGTSVTPSGTAGTKGAWAQLVAATDAPIHALMIMAQNSGIAMNGGTHSVDIAVGGSGSETIVVPGWQVATDANERIDPQSPEFLPLSLNIPAGVRLAARCSNDNSSSAVPIELAVYGFTY
jgi:hypothetical protein